MTQFKVFVTQDGKGTIICPQCGFTRRVNASSLASEKKVVRVRCTCGHSFHVSFETRKSYRKDVFIFGDYRKKTGDANTPLRQMIVRDLSQTGCQFQTPGAHDLKVGDLVYMEIPLPDQRKSLVKVTGEVRRVDGKNVGVLFVDYHPGSEKALAFFLMP